MADYPFAVSIPVDVIGRCQPRRQPKPALPTSNCDSKLITSSTLFFVKLRNEKRRDGRAFIHPAVSGTKYRHCKPSNHPSQPRWMLTASQGFGLCRKLLRRSDMLCDMQHVWEMRE